MSVWQILSYILFALFMYMPMRVLFTRMGWDDGGDSSDPLHSSTHD